MALIPAPDEVVCDDGTGFERVRYRVWPRVHVQRSLPPFLSGEALHHEQTEALGRQGTLLARPRAEVPRDASSGALAGRAPPAVVRCGVLGRLPRGCLVRRRETPAHAREAQEGQLFTFATRLAGGQPLHLLGPALTGSAPVHQKRNRGRG